MRSSNIVLNMLFPRARRLIFMCLLLVGAGFSQAQTSLTSTSTSTSSTQGSAAKPKNMRVNVYFQKIDDKGMVILKFGSVLLTTRLYGIKLKGGSAGVLSLILPPGVLLQAEVVEKGAVQSVVLWKGTKNLNEELLIQGVAEGVH